MSERTYIGEVEAFEILQEWNYEGDLPAIGHVVTNVPAIATGLTPTDLGHDEQGYYLQEASWVK